MSLNDPMFYLELAGRCLREAGRCDSRTAALGLRKLAQSYLDLAEGVPPKAAAAKAKRAPQPMPKAA